MGACVKSYFVFAALAICWGARAEPPAIPESCRAGLDTILPGWKLAAASAEGVEWAAAHHVSPVIGVGDFDGDGRDDLAVLVEHAGARKLAVCFFTAQGSRVTLIANPYCLDTLSVSKANSEHYNYDTDKTEVIKHDGISVACGEAAGATYVYEQGVFRKIVDSD
jgi:hypothetical protein